MGNSKLARTTRHVLISLLPDNKRVRVVIFMDIMLSAYMCLFIQRNIQIIYLNIFKMRISFLQDHFSSFKSIAGEKHIDLP